MSLFKTREWWSSVIGENEEFDQGCLCVANLDNNKDGADKIIVGSFHGFVRIYCPRPQRLEGGGWAGPRPEDVLCETHVGLPVLQLEAGRFVSASDSLHLAVLHPRKLTVHSLQGTTGRADHGNQYQLKQVYEHNLQRTAFNFCFGPFGGVQGKDYICIQSMDGTISIFEQESFAFSRFLPNALLPGPIRFVPRMDSFVTVSSQRQVESYKYQVLATATETKTKEESQNLRSGKRVAADWTYNIGESALDLVVYPSSQSANNASIYVLGERNMFVLSEGGKLRFMKKFDFNPSCFLPFCTVGENTNCMVATYSNALLIYSDVTLKWAAQLTQIPVQMRVANFPDLKGAVVTLTEEGQLSCGYLGTDPSMFTPPSAEVREIDYDDQDREMKQLQRQIKEHSGRQTINVPTGKQEDDLEITMVVHSEFDEPSYANDLEYQDDDTTPSISVKMTLKARTHINDVQVTVTVPPPVVTADSFITFPSLDPGRNGETTLHFYMKYNMLPHNLTADVSASFLTTSNAPRVIHAHVRLPLRLVVKPVMPVKTATFKITVDTNKPPVNLNDLFPELLGDSSDGAGNALGFRFYGCDPVVTVLASKTSQRYRLQCDQFECIWLLLSELVKRLSSYFARSHSDFKVSFDGPVPLQEMFEVIDRHFECRANDDKYSAMLEERAQQFRAIQRRLLTRFKDKTPSPLANLDTLLDCTYRQMMALGDHVEENTRYRDQCGANLAAAVKMINLLIKMWQGLNESEFAILQQAITQDVHDSAQHGWEEMVDASITHLLRTCLAKSAKDQAVNPAPLTLLKDTQKLKKHIALLCDRLSKGAKLHVEGQQPIVSKPSSQVPSDSTRRPTPAINKSKVEVPNLDDLKRVYPSQSQPSSRASSAMSSVLGQADVPIGSQFGAYRGGPESKLPSLSNGTSEPLPDLSAPLPLLSDMGGSKYMKKKSTVEVPDLDDMGDVNGTSELVYDMDKLGL